MSDRDDGLAAFIAGVFIGGIIGAATMLLLAPQSGEDTRTYIKDKSIELKRSISGIGVARTRQPTDAASKNFKALLHRLKRLSSRGARAIVTFAISRGSWWKGTAGRLSICRR